MSALLPGKAKLELAIWPLVGVFSLVSALIGALIIADYRDDATAGAQADSEQVVRAAEASVNRSLIGVDLLLAGLDRVPGVLPPRRDAIEPKTARAVLGVIADQNLLVTALMLVDERCDLLVSTEETHARTGHGLPEGFCAQALSHRAAQLTISVPTPDFASGERVLFMARTTMLADGARLLVVASVPVSQLTTVLFPSVDSPGLSVTLERDDGMLLASVPANSPKLGTRLSPPLSAAGADGRASLATARLRDEAAFVSSRPTVYRTLIVSAAIGEEAALAKSDDHREIVLGVVIVFIVLSVAAGLMMQAHLRGLGRAAEETNAAKAVLDQALEAMGDGFLLCDAEDRVVTWNSRYLETFPHLREVIAPGVPFEALAEVAARTVKADSSESERRQWIEERMAAHKEGRRDFEQRLPDGTIIHGIERRTSTGGIVSVLRDVTRERAAAAELARAKTAAEAANDAKTRFLATMSHEIRTPLNGVLGMNGLLLESSLTDEQRGLAETVRSSGQALLSVINDILDFSKLEAGRMQLELAPFRPAVLIDEVAALLEVNARAKGIGLRVDLPRDLPDWVDGDHGRLRQVLFNLIGNAVKFTDVGQVTVSARCRDVDDTTVELAIAISDTGIGIKPEVLDRLFDRFQQADNSTSRRFGGSGLGLAISRELVTLMGGTIAVESHVDSGSTFTVTLPLKLRPHSGTAAEPAPDAADLPPGPMPSMRILVAEDNSVNQLLIKTLLHRMGHFVDIVADGREALAQVQAAHYDLVLMDIQMPEMDGETATRAIRRLPGAIARIPIIALTANVMAEHRASYLTAGMDDHVGKPIDRRRLEQVLARIATSRHTR